MASLFEIGKSGVQAYRQALSVTGQNIANVNTEGYNKRSADLEEVPSVQGGVTNVPDQSGLGVRVNQIRRSFDAFLSANLRDTNGEQQKLESFVDKLNKLENMLLPSDSDLGTFIGRFFSSLQDVASRPDELSARTVALENGKALANSFNTYDNQLNNFKSTSHNEVKDNLKVVNSLVDQLAQVNKLIMSGGSKKASPDILDARDNLLLDLSKFINFTVDYGEKNDAIVKLGNSGNGKILLEKTNKSTLLSEIQEDRLIFKMSRNGINATVNDISAGLIGGIRDFFNFVGEVQKEINELANRLSKDFNEIQLNGIDLNGRNGNSMFSINSMKPVINQSENRFNVEMIVGNENIINQEKMIFKYVAKSNSWEVSNSDGIKLYSNNNLNFKGFSLKTEGNLVDNDQFIIQPSLSKAASFSFLLKDPSSIAAASKQIISASLNNISQANLKIIGKENIVNKSNIRNIDEIFSSSNNPLLSTTFLNEGAFTIIPPNSDVVKVASLSNQSSAQFNIFDNQIRGFSNITINLSDGNSLTLTSATEDPGDGIKSVKELAEFLNSGLALDGKNQQNFRKFGLFASGGDGGLTIKSSNADVTSASILSNGNTFSASISQLETSDVAASKIQLFTRDGRHISGSALSSSDIAKFLKESNGFLKNAEYKNDYLNLNYRGLNNKRITTDGDFFLDFGSNISYDKQATDNDGLFTNKNATSLSGSLTLDGVLANSNDLDSFVTITSSANDTSVNFTIKGYDQDGIFQTETIAGGDETSVTGTKIFKSITSISASTNPSGELKIGMKASGYNLKITNDNDQSQTISVPINSSAYYTAKKLNENLAGTGVIATAKTRLAFGPLSKSGAGTFSFDLKGSNTDKVSITTTVDANDLSGLARQINQFTSQTNVRAINTSDFDRIILVSDEGYDIEMTNIVSPSDFKMVTLNDEFELLTVPINVDIDDTNENTIFVKGNIRFSSSSSFTSQIDSGNILSASQSPSFNSFYDINYSDSGEKITFKPISMGLLDDNVTDESGKRAQAGLSNYGINVPLHGYRVFAKDDDSLFTSSNPGSAGALSLNGALINESNLNSSVIINCEADESSNTFIVRGTNFDGNTITETITGVNSGTVESAQIFKSITSITTTATSNGNIKIGTSGSHKLIDFDSLVTKDTYSSGSITMKGILSTADYLNARIRIECFENDSTNSFTISGMDFDGNTINETISGTNGTAIEGTKVFKKITSISVTNNTAGNIRIGTVTGDNSWEAKIDTNSLDADTSQEISLELLKALRSESPTSILKGTVINQLPSEESKISLMFEGQKYNLEMNSGEVIVDGLENNRILASFEEMSDLDEDALSKSQNVAAGGNFSLNGDNSGATFLGTRVTIKSVEDESNNSFTISGTDLNGNSISERINGGDKGQTVSGLKIFKTITSATATSDTSGKIELGTAPGYKLTITAQGSIEGDQFELVQDTRNLSNASNFGLKSATSLLLGNLIKKPSIDDNEENSPLRLSIKTGENYEDYNVKFFENSSSSQLFSSNSISANTALSINATNLLAGKVTISTASGGDQSSTSFTIVGTDMSGNAQTEVIKGSKGGLTSTGLKVFRKITSITPGAVGSGNVEIGKESTPVFYNNARDINLISSASVSASASLGTVKTHLGYGGKIKIFTSTGGNQSSTTFTISGTDFDGNAISENITGPNGDQFVVGTKTFKTVTSVTAGGTVGSGNVSVDYVVNSDVSFLPPSGLEIIWEDNKSGTTDTDSLVTSKAIGSGAALGFDGALSNTDDDSLFTLKQITSSDTLNLDGILSKNKNLYAKVQFNFTGNETGKTFTVAGYDKDGVYKTDTINGSSGTVNGSVEFTEIVSITPSSATGNTVKIGTVSNSVLVNGSTVSITSGEDLTSNKFTVTGLDMFGQSMTEVITGGNNSTVIGKKVFNLINSIVPSAAESGNVSIGTKATGRLSISHNIGKNDVIISRDPKNYDLYGFKTQKTRAVIENDAIELSSLNGRSILARVPENSTKNIVSEQISISNLPNEELIAIVMGGGAKKISSEFQFIEGNTKLDETEYEIKVDKTNKNKVELFDKEFGHSIATRILDQNRSFEAIGSRFQFSEEAIIGDSFVISNNAKGTGDNRNVLNMLDLQLEKMRDQNKGNFQEIFSNTVAKVGSNVQANDLSLKAADSNKKAAESAQSEFAGVSLDDEASHLLEFQQAYQASARILQTARELFEALIKVV